MTDTKSSAGDNAIREYLAGAAPERFAIGDERTNRRTAVTIPITKSKRKAARNTRFAPTISPSAIRSETSFVLILSSHLLTLI